MRKAHAATLALIAAAALVTPASAQDRASHVIIIGGIGGEPEYQQAFLDWGTRMAKASIEKFGVPRQNVTFLTEKPGPDAPLVSGSSSKAAVEQAFRDVAARAGSDDLVFILLIGHGTFLNGESRINLPGPDLSAPDFAALVKSLGSRRVVLANVASASGEFVKAISGPNRIVIAATKSGMERDQARFGKYFVDAFASDGADTDKDGAVSMLEAFLYARQETVRSYEAEQTLLTEHAVFDDNGDGVGSAEAAAGKDGVLARVTFLGTAAVAAGTEAPANASPALKALYEQKRAIEKQIDALKAIKDTMDPEKYAQELERLVTDLALKQQEIRKLEGGGTL
jgi:hypothetical protein